jgi:hypothetical protein
MKTIYIDSDFKCHLSDDGTMREVQTNFFDGKCQTYIEGYRFVPEGENWIREDGTVFTGQMVAPWKSYEELDQAQRQYERAQIADMKAALELLGVTLDE